MLIEHLPKNAPIPAPKFVRSALHMVLAVRTHEQNWVLAMARIRAVSHVGVGQQLYSISPYSAYRQAAPVEHFSPAGRLNLA